MNTRTSLSKILALILSLALVFGVTPVTVFAEPVDSGELTVDSEITEVASPSEADLATGGDKASEDTPATDGSTAPECVCENLCVEGSVNEDCPVCAEDFTLCEFEAEPDPETEPPATEHAYRMIVIMHKNMEDFVGANCVRPPFIALFRRKKWANTVRPYIVLCILYLHAVDVGHGGRYPSHGWHNSR